MDLLKNRILADGKALSESVLLVDSFLNHQVDPELMEEIGEEFARLFADASVDRIVTIESSGIAPSLMCARKLGVPMVIMKKQPSSILKSGYIQTEVFSFTKNSSYNLIMKPHFIKNGENVLIIDDFLANGEAAFGAIRLVEHAGGKVVGVGAVIAKAFQSGIRKLREAGYRVEALAAISLMNKDVIEFEEV